MCERERGERGAERESEAEERERGEEEANAPNKVRFWRWIQRSWYMVEGLRKEPPGIRSSAISELFSSASDASFFDRAPNSPESSSAEEELVFVAVCIVPRPGVELGANLKSISHRCNPILVALFVRELTEKNIHLPPSCLQGGGR